MEPDDPASVNPDPSRASEARVPADNGSPGDLVAEITALEMPDWRNQWKLLLHPDRLRLDAQSDEPVQEVMRAELAEKVRLTRSLSMKPCVTVKLGKKTRSFYLTHDDFAALKEWIGPPTAADLKVALKRRFAWVLPIGILFVVTSLPMRGDPAAGIEPSPFDLLGFTLGASLILLATLSRRIPHRNFFLLDSLWFQVLAGDLVYRICTGSSWVWVFVVLLLVSLARSGILEYRRFSVSSPERNSAVQ